MTTRDAIAAGSNLPEHVRQAMLRAYDHGRDDQVETWAERLAGDAASHSLAPDIIEGVAESRSLRDAAVGRMTDQRRQAA